MKMDRVDVSAKPGGLDNRAGFGLACWIATLLLAQAQACLAQTPPRVPNTYNEYVNRGYGYSICYPDYIFVPQGESIAGDGQMFKADDGAELRVRASYNVPYRTIEDEFKDTAAEESRSGNVTFKQQEGNWFVVSGIVGAKIFYRKTILQGDTFITFRALYPGTASSFYAEVVTVLAQCLKGARAN
jgi:hypothetical protein